MRMRMLWLGSMVLGALVVGMPQSVWSHGGGGGGGGGGHGGGGGGFGGGGHGGGFGGGGHGGGFGGHGGGFGGFGGGHHGGGFGGYGGGYHGGGLGGYGGGYHGGGGMPVGGHNVGGAHSIGGTHGAGNVGGATHHNTNTFTNRHVGGQTRNVTQGFRGVSNANALAGTHAQSLLNHRAGLTTANNSQFLRNHQVNAGTLGHNPATARTIGAGNMAAGNMAAGNMAMHHNMGNQGFNHHHGFNHRGFGQFFGFGYPFFGLGFWPYGFGYGGYGGYGYGGYGYGGYGGYGYGYPYYNYGMYDNGAYLAPTVANANTAQTGSTTDAQVFAEKGEADFKKGDYKAAVYSWRHAALDDPKNGVIHMMLAQALFATGQYNEAAGATQLAMQLLREDQWGVVVTNYRELYGRVGAYTSQLRALEKSAKQKPDDPATRFLLGFHYAYLGYPSHAVKQLDKTVELAPQDDLAKKLRDVMAAKLPNQPAEAGAGDNKPANDKPGNDKPGNDANGHRADDADAP
ncbi:MAG TPA: hypothetical protein VMV69_25360 [Pirellulales bacterium]|nr:hypothetical protein [Pirellulales bacterium]